MEHDAHELEILTFSATEDVSLPLNSSLPPCCTFARPIIVDVRASNHAGPYGPSYFRGFSICSELAAG